MLHWIATVTRKNPTTKHWLQVSRWYQPYQMMKKLLKVKLNLPSNKKTKIKCLQLADSTWMTSCKPHKIKAKTPTNVSLLSSKKNFFFFFTRTNKPLYLIFLIKWNAFLPLFLCKYWVDLNGHKPAIYKITETQIKIWRSIKKKKSCILNFTLPFQPWCLGNRKTS